MRRGFLTTLLILHGLGHANVGVWAFAGGPHWLITFLWGAAMLGYFAAGFCSANFCTRRPVDASPT